MENKIFRQLTLLDNLMSNCIECSLHLNGQIKPQYTKDSSYVLIGDCDYELLWSLMEKHGFKKEQFLIIRNTNCNGKQTENNIEQCKKWVDSYINIMMPLRGIEFGNFVEENGILYLKRTNNINTPIIPIIKSITPLFASYTLKGTSMLEQNILKLKLM